MVIFQHKSSIGVNRVSKLYFVSRFTAVATTQSMCLYSVS